jgi:hypothetical protein
MNRQQRARIARETIGILRRGCGEGESAGCASVRDDDPGT